MTELGTEATAEFVVCKETTAPPDGAVVVSVTVPVELNDPTTVVGEMVNVLSRVLLTEIVSPNEPPKFPETVEVNVKLVDPSATWIGISKDVTPPGIV